VQGGVHAGILGGAGFAERINQQHQSTQPISGRTSTPCASGVCNNLMLYSLLPVFRSIATVNSTLHEAKSHLNCATVTDKQLVSLLVFAVHTLVAGQISPFFAGEALEISFLIGHCSGPRPVTGSR
jgi:hypothetical protein